MTSSDDNSANRETEGAVFFRSLDKINFGLFLNIKERLKNRLRTGGQPRMRATSFGGWVENSRGACPTIFSADVLLNQHGRELEWTHSAGKVRLWGWDDTLPARA